MRAFLRRLALVLPFSTSSANSGMRPTMDCSSSKTRSRLPTESGKGRLARRAVLRGRRSPSFVISVFPLISTPMANPTRSSRWAKTMAARARLLVSSSSSVKTKKRNEAPQSCNGTARLASNSGNIEVRGRRISVTMVQAAPSDAACCPRELVTRVWKFTPGGLEEVKSAGEPTRLALSAIAGMRWTLRYWDRNAPAPRKPEVTLFFSDGRFAGNHGCDVYDVSARARSVTFALRGANASSCVDCLRSILTGQSDHCRASQ